MPGYMPIRLRLTLAFAGVMAIVLLGAAVLIRFSLAHDLDDSIRQSLQTRAADVGALAADAGKTSLAGGPSLLTERGATLAQVLNRDGTIVDATPLLRTTPLISAQELASAERAPLLIDRRHVAGVVGDARLLATVAHGGGGPPRIVVVGALLAERDEAINNLSLLLAIGGPVALLLASAAGYGVAAAALRPVEAMRQRAAEITGGRHGERLPVPVPRDEIRRLGETLNDMLARIDGALAHERAFVADASHELRMPLAVIKTELEFARRDDQSLEELRAAIVSVDEEADRLTRLTQDLLTMARSDRGGPVIYRQLLVVSELMGAIADRFTSRAAAADRPISVEVDGGASILADRILLEQAVGNLVENALRHGAGGIRLWSRSDDAGVQLHVTDQGPGVPPGFSATAFERFARGDAGRGRGGAGLGLSIVRAVARAHGGEAHLQNLEPAGLDAWIALPRGEDVAPALTGFSSTPD
jgi:two-component system, OmpR family, sensor kinase